MENQGYQPYYQPYQPQPGDPEKMQVQQERKNLFRIGLGLLVYLLVTAALQIAGTFFIAKIFPSFYYNNPDTPILLSLVAYLIGLPIFWGIVASMPKRRPERRKLGFGNFVGVFAICFTLMYLGALISNIIMTALEGLRGAEISNAVAQQVEQFSPAANFLLAVVMAPIVEEWICRKLIIDRLLPYSEWLAVTASALLFGLIHGNFYQFFYAALMGLLFGVIYAKTGKIWYTIFFHMVVNFTGTILPPFLSETIPEDLSAQTLADLSALSPWLPLALLYSLAQYALIICGIIFLIRYLKKGRLSAIGEKGLSRSVQLRATWLNKGTIALLVFCTIEFIYSIFI